MNREHIEIDPNRITGIKMPEESEWECYMFGNTPQSNCGMLYRPLKNREPNWFVRWMMKICFGCTWVKVDRKVQK